MPTRLGRGSKPLVRTTAPRAIVALVMMGTSLAASCGGVAVLDDGSSGAAGGSSMDPRSRLRDACEQRCSAGPDCLTRPTIEECVEGCVGFRDECIPELIDYNECLAEFACQEQCLDEYPTCDLSPP